MKQNLRDVMEIAVDVGDAYRACYTIKLGDSLYVLDAFQKKSKSGISTPRRDLDRIETRLKEARRHHETECKYKIKNKTR